MNKQVIKIIIWAVLFCLILSTQVLAVTAQYTYDNLGRLIQVAYDNGATIVYTYDAAGNRTAQQVTAFQASIPAADQGSGALAVAPSNLNFSFSAWWPNQEGGS